MVFKTARRVVVAVIGGTVALIGVAMIVLPRTGCGRHSPGAGPPLDAPVGVAGLASYPCLLLVRPADANMAWLIDTIRGSLATREEKLEALYAILRHIRAS
jgi:hypothetical protein